MLIYAKHWFIFLIFGHTSPMEVLYMIAFIQSYNLKNIKNKLLLLFILNTTDIIFTQLIVKSGIGIEANPFMKNVVDNVFYSFLIKIILPAVLLFILYYRMKNATTKQLRISNIALNVADSIYTIINIIHLVSFSILGILTIIY